ncbi:MAG TPA: ribonuclease J [Levilinea sp.]|nr:ribonuclease J [Levilinea sp.]
MKETPLRIIPLGGLGEVGKNMMVYEYGDDILVVDTGLMFPANDMLGVDYIIPDFEYLKQKRNNVRGIIITHGHEDHIGAIHHVLSEIQAPIYATPLTRGLLQVKLARQGQHQKAVLNTVQAGEMVQVGPFQIEFFHVCHSVPDSVGLGINTPEGLIVHSGDYKFDHTPVDNWPTDYAKLAEFSRRGVLALVSDSTNSERAGWTPSESVIDQALDQVFQNAQGRIIITSFASLVSRMQQVVNAASRHNRRVAFVGTSMIDNVKMARKLGYLDVPEGLSVSIDQALSMPDDNVAIMCTGSQGEPSSILGRLSTGRYRLFDIRAGDTVVLSAHPIPGNEENVYRTINRLIQRGADVIYEAIAPVHVSGHASQEEIKLLINLVRPKFLIPVHGELRQLKQHAVIGRQLGIPAENIPVIENGQVVEFKNQQMRLAERIPGGYVFVDGSGVGDVGPAIMRERESLAQDGAVVVHLVLNNSTGQLRQPPEIASRGFMLTRDADDLMYHLGKKINEVVARANGNLQRDVEQLVRTYLYQETRRSPMVFITVSKI